MQTANPENNIEYITYNIESAGWENLLENNPLKKTIIKEIYSLEQENEEYYMFLCTVTWNPFLKTKVTIEEIPSWYYPNYSLEKYETNCKKYNWTVTKESSNNHYWYKLLCEFPDWSECDARDFYRRSCLPGNTID